MLKPFDDHYFMKQAYQEALKALEEGEIPVGAVIVSNQQIIARAHNQTQQLNDVTAHAEMLAITSASNHLGAKYLNDCKIYVSLEPCPMCASALRWAQMGQLIYACGDDKNGFSKIGRSLLHPKTKVSFGIMEPECSTVLSEFFKNKRKSKANLS